MKSLFVLLPLVLLATATEARAQQVTADQQAESVSVVTALSDSERAALDSAAVAALVDTAATQPVSRGTSFFFGREIFRVYSGLGPYPEAERATRISHRLTELAQTDAGLDSLEVIDGHSLTGLRLHGQILMSVTNADAAALGLTRMEAAQQYASAIQSEITDYREKSTFESILRATLLALLLFVLFLLLLKGLAKFHRWVSERLTSAAGTRIRPVAVGSVEFLSSDKIMRAGRGALQIVRLATAALLFYVFLTSVFGLFPWTASWSRLLLHYMTTPLKAVALATFRSPTR